MTPLSIYSRQNKECEHCEQQRQGGHIKMNQGVGLFAHGLEREPLHLLEAAIAAKSDGGAKGTKQNARNEVAWIMDTQIHARIAHQQHPRSHHP